MQTWTEALVNPHKFVSTFMRKKILEDREMMSAQCGSLVLQRMTTYRSNRVRVTHSWHYLTSERHPLRKICRGNNARHLIVEVT